MTIIFLEKHAKKLILSLLLHPFWTKGCKRRRRIMKTFKECQFRYCPLVWMFHSRNLNNKINRIHERALRVTYSGTSHLSKIWLIKITLSQHTIEILELWQLKVRQGLSPLLLNEVLVERDCNYNLRRNSFLNRQRVNLVRYGTESVFYLAPEIWDILPNETGFWNAQYFQHKNGFHGNVLVDFVKNMHRKHGLSKWWKLKNMRITK